MRPIDADALYYKVKCECNPYGKPTIDFESGKKVLNLIEKAPTVERPRGEWKEIWHTSVNARVTCSVCEKAYLFYEKANFCPNCGADMRRKEGEAE